MVSWVLYVGLILLHISCSVEAKLHYAVIFPSEIRFQHSEIICIHLEGAQGESIVQISLNLEGTNTTLVEKIFEQDSIFTCVPIQVSTSVESAVVGTLNVSIKNAQKTAEKSSKVLVKKMRSSLLVQTDKAVYKPGQTVHFRILSLNEDFQPISSVLPVIELQDPGKNRIAQWLNVNVTQGLAEFSLPLSSEPPLGEYSIRIEGTVHTFTVEEYVLPKFEVSLQFLKVVMFDSTQFPLHICGRYTYGKPVQGNYTVKVCQKGPQFHDKNTNVCANFTGKLNKSGCDTIEVNSELLNLRDTSMENVIKGEASIAEMGTGIELSTTSQTKISNVINKVIFVNAESNYKVGIPYTGVIKVVDAADNPVPGINIYLTGTNVNINDTLVTDDNGQTSFTVYTDDLEGKIYIRARTYLQNLPHSFGKYGDETLLLNPVYSRTKSFLKLHSLNEVLACKGQQEVQVEFIIRQAELEKLKKKMYHLDLYYMVTSKGSIQDFGSLKIRVENKTQDLYGTATLKLPLSGGKSSTLQTLVYTLLPGGDIIADSAKYTIQRCFMNEVSVEFSTEEVLPGSDVSFKVQAASGSLCGLRVVDQSIVLMKPDKELTSNKVFDLFSSWHSGQYDHRIKETQCESPQGRRRNFLRPYLHQRYFGKKDVDVDMHSIFEGINLKVLTSADMRKREKCHFPFFNSRLSFRRHPEWRRSYIMASLPRMIDTYVEENDQITEQGEEKEKELIQTYFPETESIRTYFPETWIWELVAIEDSGNADLHHKAPDTITDWNGGALCMGPSGFGLSPPASLRVFKPFFVDLDLPYSVVRGETFSLKASVFNYLKQCIKIKVTLGTTKELQKAPCTDCDYSSCLCTDESKTFYWNMKATRLGEVNITVQTEAVNTEEFCQNEIPIVPKQGATDTIVKPLLVQPGGVLVEKSHSSVLCIQDGEDNTKKEKVFLQVPKNILKDSERAYVTVLGDIMGTALQNLDHLLAMPKGCGEQNMVLFAPNIFILQYLEKTNQLTNEIKSKATKFLETGYQRQLTYKHDDGSYSAFGKTDPQGNTWLSAFVVKSFNKARPYIFVDESHLQKSFTWLKDTRNEIGCFKSVGRLFNNAMKGGVEDDISLSAYVTIALIEGGVPLEDSLVRDAVSCLQKTTVHVTNVYTLALLAYTYTLCQETELRNNVLEQLEEKAVRGDRQLYWKRDSAPPKQDSFWYRAQSAEVEMTSYVLLALLTGANPDLVKAVEIVNWLTKQQNPYGGFSSTQDTVVALQALAKYAELTFSDKNDVTVTVTSSSGFLEEFHVDINNGLLLQKASLPTVTGEYTVTATGSGCILTQTVLRYNVPPPRSDTSFSLKVTPHIARDCLGDPVTHFNILISARYTGSREKSNMAVIEVKMLSGYIPVKSTVRKLKEDSFVQRFEIQMDMVTLYLNQVGHDPVNLLFMVEQNIEVKNLKPATAKVYDYYETDEQAVAEYKHPCYTDDNFSKSS